MGKEQNVCSVLETVVCKYKNYFNVVMVREGLEKGKCKAEDVTEKDVMSSWWVLDA